MVWACSAHRGKQKCKQGFGGKILRKRDHFEDIGVAGRIILKCIFKKWNGVMDSIDLAEERGGGLS
jgi:hypothetical protein